MTKPIYEEKPELFDGQDCRPGNSYPEASRDAVTPDYIKALIAERQKARTDQSSKEPAPAD